MVPDLSALDEEDGDAVEIIDTGLTAGPEENG